MLAPPLLWMAAASSIAPAPDATPAQWIIETASRVRVGDIY